ncbi:fungal pheromone STE3G-protein-coupled receptor [Rickenella mellea]|uniref:Fungal pheromone STE3G-protein-coupled receptor n=1 Tax=Rickenella mellea TaxID=50990 RepID=A0A4Y7PQB0_9AGAM|nr:fungal pheromone STE3G-protein-coupled receptor [Rickenella mellea]
MDLHPTYPIFPLMIFLSLVASLLPLLWIKRDNIGVLFLSLWLAIACLNQFVNSVIWYGNTRNFIPVWCDISSRLIVGITVAIPASALCMARRLYHICSMKAFHLTPIQANTSTLIEDMSICLGTPFLQMAIQYIVEGEKYAIMEDIGCYPLYDGVWPSFVLAFSWPVAIGSTSAVYSVLTIRALAKHGKEIDKFIEDKAQRKHYRRLIILALCVIIFETPFSVVVMILDLTIAPVHSYISWKDTHSNYSIVLEVPAVIWRSNHMFNVKSEMCRWILVLLAIIFYGIFGFSVEAINVYKRTFRSVVGLVGIKIPASTVHQEHLSQ